MPKGWLAAKIFTSSDLKGLCILNLDTTLLGDTSLASNLLVHQNEAAVRNGQAPCREKDESKGIYLWDAIQKLSDREITRELIPPPAMFSTLQEDHQAIASAIGMVILSIIPQDLVRFGAILLGGVVCVCNIMHSMRPRNCMKKLQQRLQSLEGKLQDAVNSGIMCRSDTNFTAQIARNMGR